MNKKVYVFSIVIATLLMIQFSCKVEDPVIPDSTGIHTAKVSMVVTANPDILPLNGDAWAEIKARLYNYDARPIPGAVILFETGIWNSTMGFLPMRIGTLTVTSAPIDDGVATTTFIAPTVWEQPADLLVFIRSTLISTDYPYQTYHTAQVYLTLPDNYPRPLPVNCDVEGAPTPVIEFQPTSPATSENVVFNGYQSSDTDGYIIRYYWNFGDGKSSSGVNPSHHYRVAGTYTIILTVVDNDYNACSTTASITVT